MIQDQIEKFEDDLNCLSPQPNKVAEKWLYLANSSVQKVKTKTGLDMRFPKQDLTQLEFDQLLNQGIKSACQQVDFRQSRSSNQISKKESEELKSSDQQDFQIESRIRQRTSQINVKSVTNVVKNDERIKQINQYQTSIEQLRQRNPKQNSASPSSERRGILLNRNESVSSRNSLSQDTSSRKKVRFQEDHQKILLQISNNLVFSQNQLKR